MLANCDANQMSLNFCAWRDRVVAEQKLQNVVEISGGRVHVPKRLREEMGLQPGQILELEVSDGRLQVEIAPVDIRLEKRRHGPVAVADAQMPTLTG